MISTACEAHGEQTFCKTLRDPQGFLQPSAPPVPKHPRYPQVTAGAVTDREQIPPTSIKKRCNMKKKLTFLQPNSTMITGQRWGWAMPFPPSSRTSLSLHLTALRTLLSKGFLLGSLVEDRIPVPQLLARVFLWGGQRESLERGPGHSHCPALLPSPSGGGIARILRRGMGNVQGNGMKGSRIIKETHRAECRGWNTRDTGLKPRK